MAMDRARGDKSGWVLAAILLVAILVRVDRLGVQSLWVDEALTLVVATYPAHALFLQPVDPTPGLYYALHGALLGTNADPWVARSLSMIAGVGTVAAIYALARTIMPRRFALLAAALASVNAVLVDYSQEARSYMLLLLLLAVAARALIGWEAATSDRAARRWALAYAVASTSAAYTQLVGTLFLLGMTGLALLFAWRRGHRDRMGLAILFVPLLLVLPEMLRLLAYARQNPSIHWLQAAGVGETLFDQAVLLAPAGALGADGLPEPRWPGAFLFGALLLTCWLVATLWSQRAALVDRWRSAPMAAALVAAFVTLPWFLYFAGAAGQPLLTIRAALPFLLGALPLIALAASLDPKPMRSAAVVILLLLLPSAVGLAKGLGRHEREDWRAAAGALRREARAGDVVVACSPAAYPALAAAMEPGGALPVPILLSYGGALVTAAPSIGAPGWAAAIREPLWSSYDAGQEKSVLARASWRKVVARRVWLVESACFGESGEQVRSLAPAPARTVWQSRRTLFHPDSRLSLSASPQPMILRVAEPRSD